MARSAIVFKVIAAAVAGCIGMVVIAFVSITHLSELRDSARAMNSRAVAPLARPQGLPGGPASLRQRTTRRHRRGRSPGELPTQVKRADTAAVFDEAKFDRF